VRNEVSKLLLVGGVLGNTGGLGYCKGFLVEQTHFSSA
jgi:hypothetical protein